MLRILQYFIFSFVFISFCYGQISEKVNIFVSGGPSLPIESSIGKSFQFMQLDSLTGTNFADSILRLQNSTSNFKDYWKPGFNIGAGLEYQLNSFVTLQGAFGYNNFTFDKNRLTNDFKRAFEDPEIIDLPYNTDGSITTGGQTDIYTITINIRGKYPLHFVTPYVIGGGGYMRINQDDINISYFDEPFEEARIIVSIYDIIVGKKEDVVTTHAGAGIIFNLGKNFQPFIEANYLVGFTKDDKTVIYPMKFGFIFSLQ